MVLTSCETTRLSIFYGPTVSDIRISWSSYGAETIQRGADIKIPVPVMLCIRVYETSNRKTGRRSLIVEKI